MASDLGPHAMFVAGGTDLFPKLKRRQFEVDALIGLDFLSHTIHRGEDETVVDAGVTLAAASGDADLWARLRLDAATLIMVELIVERELEQHLDRRLRSFEVLRAIEARPRQGPQLD